MDGGTLQSCGRPGGHSWLLAVVAICGVSKWVEVHSVPLSDGWCECCQLQLPGASTGALAFAGPRRAWQVAFADDCKGGSSSRGLLCLFYHANVH